MRCLRWTPEQARRQGRAFGQGHCMARVNDGIVRSFIFRATKSAKSGRSKVGGLTPISSVCQLLDGESLLVPGAKNGVRKRSANANGLPKEAVYLTDRKSH